MKAATIILTLLCAAAVTAASPSKAGGLVKSLPKTAINGFLPPNNPLSKAFQQIVDNNQTSIWKRNIDAATIQEQRHIDGFVAVTEAGYIPPRSEFDAMFTALKNSRLKSVDEEKIMREYEQTVAMLMPAAVKERMHAVDTEFDSGGHGEERLEALLAVYDAFAKLDKALQRKDIDVIEQIRQALPALLPVPANFHIGMQTAVAGATVPTVDPGVDPFVELAGSYIPAAAQPQNHAPQVDLSRLIEQNRAALEQLNTSTVEHRIISNTLQQLQAEQAAQAGQRAIAALAQEMRAQGVTLADVEAYASNDESLARHVVLVLEETNRETGANWSFEQLELAVELPRGTIEQFAKGGKAISDNEFGQLCQQTTLCTNPAMQRRLAVERVLAIHKSSIAELGADYLHAENYEHAPLFATALAVFATNHLIPRPKTNAHKQPTPEAIEQLDTAETVESTPTRQQETEATRRLAKLAAAATKLLELVHKYNGIRGSMSTRELIDKLNKLGWSEESNKTSKGGHVQFVKRQNSAVPVISGEKNIRQSTLRNAIKQARSRHLEQELAEEGAPTAAELRAYMATLSDDVKQKDFAPLNKALDEMQLHIQK